MVITFAVRIAGVVAVFAFLIIPVAVSAMIGINRGLRMFVAWIVALVASIAGLLFAYYLDFSVGPSIVLFSGNVLVVVAILQRLTSQLS